MDEKVASEAAAKVASEEATDGRPSDRLTLSTGIILKLTPVPQALLRRAASKVKKPEVPMALIPEKGREEENPDDPDYKQALEDWVAEQALATRQMVILMGTEIASIPENLDGPNADGWTQLPLRLGILREEELADPYLRYIAWLETYAARTDSDQLALIRLPIELAGISESEVVDALVSFRSPTGRRADNGGAPVAGGENGDHLPRAVRRRRARGGGA